MWCGRVAAPVFKKRQAHHQKLDLKQCNHSRKHLSIPTPINETAMRAQCGMPGGLLSVPPWQSRLERLRLVPQLWALSHFLLLRHLQDTCAACL